MMIARSCISIICLFVLLAGLTTCGPNLLPENEVDTVFEQDYVLINEITGYLLSLEETYVHIDCEEMEILGQLGEPMEFQSSEIETKVKELEKKGFYHITKKHNVVIFDIWRKSFNVEFEAGVVYSVDGTGDLSAIQYLTYQRPLSKESWYYYENDYNEWRRNQ